MMTVGNINGHIREFVAEGRESEAYDQIKQGLITYFSTTEGREELQNSPHRGLSVAEAVELLMQGVPARIQRELRRRDG